MVGFGIGLGVFFLVACILMLIFGSGDIFGFFGVLFVVFIAVRLIMDGIKKKRQDKKTEKVGEKCFARVLECIPTGAFVLKKEEFKVGVVTYVPSLKKRIFMEESVGFNCKEQYPKDTYLIIRYHNNDINVDEIINESEVPHDILNILKEESIEEEYDKYIKEIAAEKQEKEEIMAEKVEGIIGKVSKAYTIYTIVGFFAFSIIVIFATSYFSKMIELIKDYANNMPMAIIYPVVLVVNLAIIIPMIFSPENSKRRVFFGLLYFVTMAFIMFQGAMA